MYYNRSLDEGFVSLLKPQGPLRKLVQLTQEKWPGKDVRPDLQLRRDTITLYMGLTKVLDVRMDAKGRLYPSAALTYGLSDDGSGVKKVYEVDRVADFAQDIGGYLARVEVGDSHLSLEGLCQNWLSYRYGSARQTGLGEPVAIDREVVIGHANMAEKEQQWEEPVRKAAKAIVKGISEANPGLFGTKLEERALGNELDLLMWAPEDTLLVAEIKGGGNAHGIYMAPVQVAAYTMAWQRFAAAESLDSIATLVDQKRELELVNMDETEWGQFGASLSHARFVPAIVVQSPNKGSSCWQRLGDVVDYLSNNWPSSWGPCLMDSLRVYTVNGAEGALEDHSADWRTWGPTR
jgi:hypothetical protein